MTPNRLLDTAIDHFGRYGFDAASTRAIARASDTVMSSITYYFGGKEGLYLAAADRIVDAINERQHDAIEAARERRLDTREEAIETFLALLDSFAVLMLSAEAERWARFVIREQFEPSPAFDRLWDGLMEPISSLFLALLKRLRADLDDDARRATMILAFGQAITLRAARASTCRVLGVRDLGPRESDLLRAYLRANTLAILEAHR